MANNVGPLKVNVQFREAWWWKPAIKIAYAISAYHLIPCKAAETAVNFIIRHAFKWRIGRSKWRQITEFRVTLERK